MDPRTDEDKIEDAACQFRRMIGIDDAQIFIDAPTLIFKVHHFCPNVKFILVQDHELPAPGGRWDAKESLLIYRQSVFDAANKPNPDPRARWTIAHEIAHFACGDEGVRNRSPKGSLEKSVSAKIRKLESRTDRFTAALLAPLYLIELDESVDSIMRRFGLSEMAAEIRKEEKARLHRRQHDLTRSLPASIQSIIEELKRK